MGYRAVVLLSGGIDSAVALWVYAVAMGPDEVLALHAQYGQNAHNVEIVACRALCDALGCELDVVTIGDAFPESALTSGGQTWGTAAVVPGRNAVLAWAGMARAELVGARDVVLGATLDDAMDYPDCTEEFVRSVNKTCSVQGMETRLVAPFLGMTKPEVVRLGEVLHVDWKQTISCYCPSSEGLHCGKCASCVARMEALKQVKG
jgi:7-cyano-7-deazaguanine synthase